MNRAESRSSTFRPEIEGLRSVAFLLVAVFHIWFNRVSGGVDVFFTVAGFLIAVTLLGHLRRFGRPRAGVFFGRLAVRLLPTAIVVLIAVVAAIVLVFPYSTWRDMFTQVVASATYWENWYLGFNSIDYLATDIVRSPLQHFWAMSIQGQFYILWFLVFLAVALFARRLPFSTRRLALLTLSGLAVISFGWSLYQTANDQQFAYFSTLTRIWEFALGAVLALVIDRIKLPRHFAAMLSWIGLVAIVSVGALLPVADMFPGYVALVPVLAACAVIVSGQQQARWGSNVVLASRPLVWMGKLGYGVYLWHWPILIVVLEIQGRSRAGILTGSAVIVMSIILAFLTRKLVEEPILKLRSAAHPKIMRVAVAACASAAVIVAGVGGAGVATVDYRAAEEQRQVEQMQEQPCFGAGAMDAANECGSEALGEMVIPSSPAQDYSEIFEPECATSMSGTDFKPCTWGDSDGATRVALIGNSHGAVWFPALLKIAEDEGWRLDTYFKHSCAFNATSRSQPEDTWMTSCDEWSLELSDHLASVEPYDFVMTSAIAQNDSFLDPATGSKNPEAGVSGYQQVWQPLVDRGSTILAMRDYPRSSPEAIACALQNGGEGCDRSLAESQVPLSDEVLAVAASSMAGAELVDMTDWFCMSDRCPQTIGNVFVYRDPAHFTATYGRSLAEPLRRELEKQAGVQF